jgi:spore germination protein YaaH
VDFSGELPFSEEAYQMAAGKEKMLMVSVGESLAEIMLSDLHYVEGDYTGAEYRIEVPRALAAATTAMPDYPFDGIVVDIEGLRGVEQRELLNEVLRNLRAELDKYDKKMYVAVHPKRRDGQAYYDGYDYKTIGQLADKVVLMAHDYNAKQLTEEEMAQGIVMTPLAPIDEVYYALRAITDPESGVEDHSKIVLQLNFAIAQWKLLDGQVSNNRPYTPAYEALVERIETGTVEFKYDETSESPYLTFADAEDGTYNVVWYEDERSIAAKTELAELFGITGISVWRLGNVPDYKGEGQLDVLSMLTE